MKKVLFVVLTFIFVLVSLAGAQPLKVGDSASDFKLKDAKGKEFTLSASEFAGRVLLIMYVDPDEKDLNVHVEDALLKERDAGNLSTTAYRSFGVTNLKDTNKPNFLIRQIIKSKQEKTGAIILLDYDHSLLNLWGLKRDSSDVILLDKNRICQFIHRGKMSPDDVTKVIELIKEYQAK
ncbi:MAG: YtfJ family protein [Smithellaceae bacterium]|nr:YtfJ family protein [Smithellaceae bacterium]